MEITDDRVHRRRRHACPHILGILEPIVHDLPHRDARDPDMALPCPHQERSAPGHGPVGGERSLAGISERKPKLLLRTPEVAGRHCQHVLPVSGSSTHGRKRKRLTGCGTRPIQPEHGDLQSLHSHGGGDPLPEQISAEQISHLFRRHMRLPESQRACLFLHVALRFLPGLRSEQIVLIYHIEQLRQRAFPFLAPRH